MLGSDDTSTPTVRTPIEGPPEATPPPVGSAPSLDAPPPPSAAPPPSAVPPPSAAPPLPPAWRPPQADHDRGRAGPLIAGVVILVIGLWFFATQTLGLDLPRLDWRQFWPVILIVIGIWIVARSFGRTRDR